MALKNVEVKKAGIGRICVRANRLQFYLNNGYVLASETLENNEQPEEENLTVVDHTKPITAPYADHLLDLLHMEVKRREAKRGVNIIVHEPRNKEDFVAALEQDDEDPDRWS